MLLAECLRKDYIRLRSLGFGETFSPYSNVTEDRHTPENVEGLPVHRRYTRVSMHASACSRKILEKAKLRKREARE